MVSKSGFLLIFEVVSVQRDRLTSSVVLINIIVRFSQRQKPNLKAVVQTTYGRHCLGCVILIFNYSGLSFKIKCRVIMIYFQPSAQWGLHLRRSIPQIVPT